MTPSTSSSSTGPSQGQPTQLYTTAGTVYNPSAVVPLQPPTRKGRISRWLPPSQGELNLFNKSVPPGYPYRRSPPTTASSLKHYSPLQQNSDRAVEPPTTMNHLNRSTSDSSSSLSFAASHPLGIMAGLEENNGQHGSSSLQYEDKEEEELGRISTFGVKALTSLASYPNLHQHMAQRALDKARETVKAAETSRPMSPTSSRQVFQRQQEGTGVLQQTTNLGRDYGDTYGRQPKSGHGVGSTRSNVLSSGPGAPRPLTAGPPGQRQYRAATLEGAFRALQSNSQRPSSTIDEADFDINPSTLVNLGRPATTRMPYRTQTQSSSGFGKPSLHNAFVSVHPQDPGRRPSRTRDTLPVDPLRPYFPRGFPSDYHYDPKTVAPFPPNGADLELQEGRYLPTPEELRLRDARSKAAFYSSSGELLKTLDDRIIDARNKLQEIGLGVNGKYDRASARQASIDNASNSSKLGKPNDEFTTEFVKELPTHEAATPLVNMAFSTLLSYWDNGRLSSIPTGFVKMEDYELWLRSQGKDGGAERAKASHMVPHKLSR